MLELNRRVDVVILEHKQNNDKDDCSEGRLIEPLSAIRPDLPILQVSEEVETIPQQIETLLSGVAA